MLIEVDLLFSSGSSKERCEIKYKSSKPRKLSNSPHSCFQPCSPHLFSRCSSPLPLLLWHIPHQKWGRIVLLWLSTAFPVTSLFLTLGTLVLLVRLVRLTLLTLLIHPTAPTSLTRPTLPILPTRPTRLLGVRMLNLTMSTREKLLATSPTPRGVTTNMYLREL